MIVIIGNIFHKIECQSNVIPFWPIWTNMGQSDQSGPIWNNLDQSRPIWTNLDQYGPIWTNLDQSGGFWTHSVVFCAQFSMWSVHRLFGGWSQAAAKAIWLFSNRSNHSCKTVISSNRKKIWNFIFFSDVFAALQVVALCAVVVHDTCVYCCHQKTYNLETCCESSIEYLHTWTLHGHPRAAQWSRCNLWNWRYHWNRSAAPLVLGHLSLLWTPLLPQNSQSI